MAEVKFIFTADDSKLQDAIARVEKSLGKVGLSSAAASKSAGGVVDDLADSMSSVGEKVKSASELFDEYDKKVIVLTNQLKGLKTQLDNLPIGAEKEKVKEITDEIARVNDELEKYKNLRHEAGAQNLQDSGISFTFIAPEPVVAEGGSFSEAEGQMVGRNIEQINQQTDALAKTREEYDKILAAIKETDSNTLKLANTNDAVAATFTRIGEVSQTLKLASNELKQLNSELEKAKAAGDDALAETLSKQIEEVKSKIPSLNRELKELVTKEEELRKKQQELLQLTKETREVEQQETAKAEESNDTTSEESTKKKGGIFSKENWEGTTASMGEFSKGLSQVTEGFKKMATGSAGAAKGLQMITGGIKTMSKALLSLLANPIVLIISGVVLAIAGLGKALSKYFTQTEEGAEKFAKIKAVFNSVKVVVENFTVEVGRKVSEIGSLLINVSKLALQVMIAPVKTIVLAWKTLGTTIVGIAQGVIQGFKTGDWSKVGENVKTSITNALNELKGEVDTAKENIGSIADSWNGISGVGTIVPDDLLDKTQKIEKAKVNLINAEKKWEEERSKLDAKRSELQEVMYSGSQTEQIDAMNEMKAITEEKYKNEIELAKERLRIQQEENALQGNNVTTVNKDKERKLTIELNKLTIQQNNELRTMARRYKSVTNALEEQKKTYQKELLSQRKENEKLTNSNQYNEEIDMLKLRIKYENDTNAKLNMQKELRKTNLDYQLKELEAQKKLALEQVEIDKKRNIEKTYGKDALQEYEQTGTLQNDSQGVLEFYKQKAENIEKQYSLRAEGEIAKSGREEKEQDLEDSLSRFEKYLQGMLDAEQRYQMELKTIRERYGLSEGADVENSKDSKIAADVNAARTIRDSEVSIVERDTNMAGNLLVEQVTGLGEQIAGKTKEEIFALYNNLISSLTTQIEALKADTSGDPMANLEKRNQLVIVRARLEKEVSAAIQNAESKGERAARLQQNRNAKIVKSLESVRDIAKDLADTFGGVLSKDAKKALDAMAGVADFGISAVQGIETIVSGVSNGMIKTTEGASKSMQALEKASFILTVISIAVQLIMKIVEIASQFTTSAQLQDAIDEHLAKVDELKRKQQLIESQYATSQGSKYYKGLAEQGKKYKGIIEEINAALEDAERLYLHNKSKYGEDSNKTKDAKAQWQDLQQERQDAVNADIEHWRGLMEELSGTSLESFSENLADSLIEGFENGTEGIEDTWEEALKNMKRTMMREALALALQDQFKNAFNLLTDKTKDGVLSEDDMNEFIKLIEQAESGAKAIAESYYNAFSESGLLDDADAEGSEGFGQMTQDQADTLTARFTAVQIEMSNVSAATQAMAGIVTEVGTDIKAGIANIQSLLYNSNIALQIAQDQLDQMQAIADNTAMLNETNNRLRAIEQNTSKL